MGVVRLAVCVTGVYAAFLLWAIAQERLSVPFPAIPPLPHTQSDKFPSPLFLNYAQSLASSLSAIIYLLLKSWNDGTLRARGWWKVLGFATIQSNLRECLGYQIPRTPGMQNGNGKIGEVEPEDVKEDDDDPKGLQKGKVVGESLKVNGSALSNRVEGEPALGLEVKGFKKSLFALLIQVSIFQTMAGPIGFLALRHISYPTMVLGKSCKLIPVMLLNVLLYRRRFSSHKYIVVALVTVGISMFMLLGPRKRKGGNDSVWGLNLMVFGLFIDGLTNSTQDQIFSQYPLYTGQQMMAHMAMLTQALLLPALFVPLPTHPWILLQKLHIPISQDIRLDAAAPIEWSSPAFLTSLHFLRTHPTAWFPLLAYALLGGLGQLFIFETIQHFGSLTLVMVTVTRKLFTMLLSVFVFKHHLTKGQWGGVAVVFAGIGVEAGMKRRDVMKKARRDSR